MEREGHCKQTTLACVRSALSRATALCLPQPKVVCTSRVHTAQALECSARALSQVCPAFFALPWSKSLLAASQGHSPRWADHCGPFPGLSSSGHWVLGEHTVPGGSCTRCTSLVLADQFPRCAMRPQYQLCCVSPLGSWSQAVTLLPDVYLPGSQKDVLSNWELAHSLVEDEVLGAQIATPPCLLALAATHLPLCLQGERDLYSSWLALQWYSLNPLFCECARGRCVVSKPFTENLSLSLSLSLSFSLSLTIPGVGLLSHISSLRLSSGHSGLVLTLRTNDDAAHSSLPSPHSLLADGSICALLRLCF